MDQWTELRQMLIYDEHIRLASERTHAKPGHVCSTRLSKSAARRHVRYRKKAVEGIEKFEEFELESTYAEYVKLWNDQSAMKVEVRETMALERILRMCHKVGSVGVFMFRHLDKRTRLCKRLYEDKSGVGPYGDHLSFKLGLTPAMAMIEAVRNVGCADRISLSLDPISYQFFGQKVEVMERIFEVTNQLQGLHIGLHGEPSALRKDRTAARTGLELDPATAIEAYRQHEELTSYWISPFRIMKELEDHRLANFFSHTANLKALSFRGIFVPSGPTDEQDPSIPPLSALVDPKTHWPRLTSLHLQQVTCANRDLADLISLHQNTLQNLSLQELQISNIQSCFESFAGKLPNLQTVTLRDQLGEHLFLSRDYFAVVPDQYTRALQRYILQGVRQFPQQKDASSKDIDYSWEEESPVCEGMSDKQKRRMRYENSSQFLYERTDMEIRHAERWLHQQQDESRRLRFWYFLPQNWRRGPPRSCTEEFRYCFMG